MYYDILLFDADDTLFDFGKCEEIAFEKALSKVGVDLIPGMTGDYSAINLECWKRLERGELSREDLKRLRFAVFLEKYGIDRDPAVLARAYEEELSRTAVLFPGAEDLIRRLSEKARVYVITNGLTAVQRGRFSRSPITKYLSGVFISEEIGYNKPDRRYFDAVIRGIPGFDRDRAIVIGDSLTSDVKGANNAGLRVLWYDPKGKGVLDEDVYFDARVGSYGEIEEYLERCARENGR